MGRWCVLVVVCTLLVSGCVTIRPSAPPVASSTSTVTVTKKPAAVPLYTLRDKAVAVGTNGRQTDATLAGKDFPKATGMWVGCEGTPASTTYQLGRRYAQLTASAGLQPHTPTGLTARVTITGDGKVLDVFTATSTAIVPVKVGLDGVSRLTVEAILQDGTCSPSDTPYGALGDALVNS